MRNYDNPITVLLTGSGNSNAANTSVLFEDFIFGALENADARFVVTHTNKSSGIDTALKVLDNWGINEDSGDLSFVNTFQGALGGLKFAAEEGRDVYVVSLFDSESENDLAEITRAKKEGVPTLNLCASLVDHFEGYESEEDRVHREAVTEAFEEQQKAKEEAEAVAKPARKRAPAKKATAPRKKAAAKPLEEESKPLEDEPEKPAEALHVHKFEWLESDAGKHSKACACGELACDCGGQTLLQIHTPEKCYDKHKHTFVWADDQNGNAGSICACGEIDPATALTGTARLVANAVAREAEKKMTREEKAAKDAEPTSVVLSGTIVAGKMEHPKELEPALTAAPIAPVVDVWQDVAAAVPASDTITVRKDDVVALGDAMKEMASGFNKAIEVYQRMVTGE